jgi:hypothetical protein
MLYQLSYLGPPGTGIVGVPDRGRGGGAAGWRACL